MRLSGACWLSLGTGALAHPRVSPGSQYVRRQSGPVPPDTIKDCTYFYDSQPGDTCASIASGWGVTLQEFVTYNPSVKTDCSGLVVGSSYCVEQNYGNGPSNPVTTSSTATSEHSTTTTSPAPTEPTPVQSGISSQCKTASTLRAISLRIPIRQTVLQGARRRYMCWYRQQISYIYSGRLVSAAHVRFPGLSDDRFAATRGIPQSAAVSVFS